MAEPFLAEIRMMGFNFAPRGWAQCNGQIMPINQNQSLYSLLGTTYGGDGRTSFALPDLRGRAPIHEGTGDGSSHSLGGRGGSETVALTLSQIPAHGHTVYASTANASSNKPANRVWGRAAQNQYRAYEANNAVDMRAGVIQGAGAGQGHENMQPSLAINFCIALQGLFPSRS